MHIAPQQAALVRSGFEQIRHRLEPASVAFYEALFRRRPDLRGMFREDLEGQGMKFMSTLGTVVECLDAPEGMAGHLRELGRTHATLGVKIEHFAPMGEALIETLADELGSAFTPEAEAAWRAAYDGLSRTMISGGID